MKTPTIKEMRSLLITLKPYIHDDYVDEPIFEYDNPLPYMEVTVGCNKDGEWSYQTGDNSFMGGAYHYPHWAVITLQRRSNCTELARDIINQLAELMA